MTVAAQPSRNAALRSALGREITSPGQHIHIVDVNPGLRARRRFALGFLIRVMGLRGIICPFPVNNVFRFKATPAGNDDTGMPSICPPFYSLFFLTFSFSSVKAYSAFFVTDAPLLVAT